MRLPYVDNPPNFDNESDNAVVKRVQERRGERGLIALDLALLHAPPVADGWNTFLKAIRTSTTLTPSIREVSISRVAVLNRAWYEFEHHAILIPSIPLSGLKYILTSPPSNITNTPHKANDSIGLDAKHAAVLTYTDYMTLAVEMPDEVFKAVRDVFSEREVVELTATVGSYNCVSRFLVALDVSERNGEEGKKTSLEKVHPELVGLEPAPRS
ncbi:hypothetical protein EJ08DRAFT_686927 [Tothia fuscella]|uniref:Carboxymuconolactone decarboxylase n=1 Tax=Tothia fuscella TaxID=1048955 RepID=A0A9P4U104_9PEZI|nr:hypothetical protein EJ08DRAFT_686927 [Tothia fuscella]